MDGITQPQLEVLKFICEYINENTFPPTLAEINTHFKFKSSTGCRDKLIGLEKKGYIKRGVYVSRSIRVIKFPPDYALYKGEYRAEKISQATN